MALATFRPGHAAPRYATSMTRGIARRRWLAATLGAGASSACPLSFATPGPVARAFVEVRDSVLRRDVPAHFLSFNMNVVTLDADHGTEDGTALRPDVVDAMRAFPGALYRYPGGNVSNRFAFDTAIGDMRLRQPQRLVDHADAAPVRFGPAEYLRFLDQTRGQSWYTLNLVGWGNQSRVAELPSADVAAANGRLAAFRAKHDRTAGGVRYYHLGNELDRNVYRWPPAKYIQRCRETMVAVRAADPQARFVAFLRDFSLPSGSTVADGLAHARTVLDGLPEVRDVSLQVYYDRAAGEGRRADLAWRWPIIDRFIEALPTRSGEACTVWVTEHAIARDLTAKELSRRDRLATTSGIEGAVACCDFLIGALRRPAIEATFWHALGGGVWWDLFEPGSSPLRPTPVYHALRLVRGVVGADVYDTTVKGSNVGGYAGGYDVNAVALRGKTEPATLLLVNRAAVPAELDIAWSSLSTCRSTLKFVASDVRRTPSNALAFHAVEGRPLRTAETGPIRVVIPAHSVSMLQADSTATC